MATAAFHACRRDVAALGQFHAQHHRAGFSEPARLGRITRCGTFRTGHRKFGGQGHGAGRQWQQGCFDHRCRRWRRGGDVVRRGDRRRGGNDLVRLRFRDGFRLGRRGAFRFVGLQRHRWCDETDEQRCHLDRRRNQPVLPKAPERRGVEHGDEGEADGLFRIDTGRRGSRSHRGAPTANRDFGAGGAGGVGVEGATGPNDLSDVKRSTIRQAKNDSVSIASSTPRTSAELSERESRRRAGRSVPDSLVEVPGNLMVRRLSCVVVAPARLPLVHWSRTYHRQQSSAFQPMLSCRETAAASR